jgi:signal transduction histidine kinase/pSer/pThr/pTyr-binding forkhead associated (FHA) protein
MLVLTVIQGPDKGKKYELPANEPQLIGRSSEALPNTDNAMSRRHAELTPDDGLWFIRDLQSQNGTYVNGLRITDRTRLRPGDQIRAGQTLLVFGKTLAADPDVVRVVGPSKIDAAVEKTLASAGLTAGLGDSLSGVANPLSDLLSDSLSDSLILAEPEPRAAAVDHLRVIYRLSTLLTTQVLDRTQLLKSVLDLVFNEFSPERGCIMMMTGPMDSAPAPVAIKYKSPPIDPDDAKIHVSRTILYHALSRSEGVLSTNAMADPRFASGDSVQRAHVRSAICSPIRFRDRMFGAIYIDSTVANYTFTPEQLSLLNAIGQHAGLALANAELYQQKLQSERLAAMGETVAMLSHSIKNILQGLRGGADVVEMGLKRSDLKIASGGWAILKRNLDRIISLTMNMLAFSRQRTVELDLTPIGPLIEDCAQLLEGLCSARQVALLLDVDAEIPPIPLDAPLVHQALMNLLTNGVEAVDPGRGVVTVRATYRPHGNVLATPKAALVGAADAAKSHRPEIEIAIIDNGPGIPMSKQPWVFDPFNTTKGVKGTGLGLAVAKRIAEEHGGAILLESMEHKGATFRLVLPADPSHLTDPSATQAERLSSRTGAPFGAGGAESV